MTDRPKYRLESLLFSSADERFTVEAVERLKEQIAGGVPVRLDFRGEPIGRTVGASLSEDGLHVEMECNQMPERLVPPGSFSFRTFDEDSE